MIFLAILLWPILEISLAVAVVREFGFANAFFAWLVSLVLGLGLFRTSSLRLTVGVAKAMREGKPPGLAALDGALVGLAGVFFIIPGYFSDLFAVALLIAPLRRLAAKRLIAKFSGRGGAAGAGFSYEGRSSPTGRSAGRDDAASTIIDVDAVVVEDRRIGGKNSDDRNQN